MDTLIQVNGDCSVARISGALSRAETLTWTFISSSHTLKSPSGSSWSDAKSSRTMARALMARSECVLTSFHFQADGCRRRREFGRLQRPQHMHGNFRRLHSLWHAVARCGILRPNRVQTCQIVSSSNASTLLPLRLNKIFPVI